MGGNAMALSSYFDPRPDLANVRDVVLIASSSRSGSSLFAEWLKQSVEFLQLQHEIDTAVKIASVRSIKNESDSDADDFALKSLETFAEAFFEELGHPVDPDSKLSVETVAIDLERSLRIQWPEEHWYLRSIIPMVAGIFMRLGWRFVRDFVATEFMLDICAQAISSGMQISPYRYDIPAGEIRARFPHLAVPAGPLSVTSDEETPFVIPRPWKRASMADVQGRTIVLKGPGNAYRISKLRALFPAARFRVIHLVRNPAATVNGLIDGWLYWNFFSRQLAVPLAIDGYTDPSKPWTSCWWKFDLPPGWSRVRSSRLVDVCGFQWQRAHECILQAVAEAGLDVLHVKYEDFRSHSGQGLLTRRHILKWLGACDVTREQVALPSAPVMSTSLPRPYRWRDRKDLIEPVVRRPEIYDLARQLGYCADVDSWT
jgi:hypothetical protein